MLKSLSLCIKVWFSLVSLSSPLSLIPLSLPPSLSLPLSLPLYLSLTLFLSPSLSPPIPSPSLSSCPSASGRGICGCFLKREGMWTDKWSLSLKLHCLMRASPCLPTFKADLKTYLFHQAFWLTWRANRYLMCVCVCLCACVCVRACACLCVCVCVSWGRGWGLSGRDGIKGR